jgi:hypothetical protein
MKSTEPVTNVSEADAVVLKRRGITEVKPMARPTLKARISHAVSGCTTIKHLVLNQQIGRVVEIGRICPICFREYPSGRSADNA